MLSRRETRNVFPDGSACVSIPPFLPVKVGLPPGCALLCLLQPWRVPHLGPSTRNYVPFIPTPLPNRTSLAAYCYSINLYFINDDSKKVILMLMLITATLKHHFPSEAFPACDQNHREEKAQRFTSPRSLSATSTGFSNWFLSV